MRARVRDAREPFRTSRPWTSRNRRPSNHPRTSFETRIFGTRSQRAFFIDGLLSSASDVIILNFLSIYAIALGASNTEVGWLAIANGAAGAAALLPGARIAERARSRKWVVLLTGGGVGRLCVLLMALAPSLLAHREVVLALVVLTGVRWFAGGLGHPAWMSLLSDIIPADLRRFYISRRMLGMAAVAAVAAPLAGLFVRFAGGVSSVSAFQWAFLIAFGFGALSTCCYSRIEEPPRPTGESRGGGSTGAMLRDRGFVRFLSGTLLLHSSTMIAGPFFAAYLVRDLGATATAVGVLATVDALSTVLGQYASGRLAVSRGSVWLLKSSMLLLPLLPLLWAASTSPWHPLVPNLIGGAAWAAFNLASFNLVLEYAPPENLPRYAATHQSAVLASSLVGPAIGTAIVATSGLRAAMLVSAAGRIFALGVIAWPGARAADPAAVGDDTGEAAPSSDVAAAADTDAARDRAP